MIEATEVTTEYIEEMKVFREPDKTIGLIEAGAKNICVFAQNMLGIKLYSWQVKVLHDIQEAVFQRREEWNKFYPVLSKIEEAGYEYEYKDTEEGVILEYTDEKGEVISYPITIGGAEFIALTSRQVGKSTFLAILSTWVCIYNHIPATLGNNTSVGIASAGDKQAKKLLQEIKKMMRLGDARMGRYKQDGESVFGKTFFSDLLDDKEDNNKEQITFKRYDKEEHGQVLLVESHLGSTIKSYPPTATVLGESFSLVVEDEAGKTDKITDEFHKDFMYPTGNSTFAIRIYTSTPWVNSGFFYELVDPDNLFPDRKDLHKYCYTIESIRLENPLYYKVVMKQVNELNAAGDTDTVQRAYFCRFIKGQASYFNPLMVFDIFDSDTEMLQRNDKPCDVGIDFGGQVKSRTVVTISYMDDDGHVHRLYHRVYPVKEDNTLMEDLAELMTRFDIQRVIPEECLVAGTEVLMSDYTRKNIEDILPGESVWSYDFDKNEYVRKKVLQRIETGKVPTSTVSFRNGTQVTTSENHKWFAMNRKNGAISVKTTRELDPQKDCIPVALNIPHGGETSVSGAEAYLLGMYIAEGHRRPNNKSFFISQFKEEEIKRIEFMLNKTSFKWQRNKKGFYLSTVGELTNLFLECGESSYTKRIPEECFKWSDILLTQLRNGLMDGDGNIQNRRIDKRGYSISQTESYYTVSNQLDKDFRLLSLLLNKPCHFRSRVHSGFGSMKEQYEPVWVEGSYMNKGTLFIKEIYNTFPQKTYDIEVDDTHSFILPETGAITHNCPQGDYLIREMEAKGWDVHPTNPRSEKVKKYGAFRAMLNKGKIHSYMDEDLRTEMLALEFSRGSKQSLIQHAPNYNDDMIDSFMMSTYFFIQDDDSVQWFGWNEEK